VKPEKQEIHVIEIDEISETEIHEAKIKKEVQCLCNTEVLKPKVASDLNLHLETFQRRMERSQSYLIIEL
jgi:hypothetical protein